MTEELKRNLEAWAKYKKLKDEYEDLMEEAKSKVVKYMKDKDINVLSTDDYLVKSSSLNRETISKNDLPPDIWQKYCKKNSPVCAVRYGELEALYLIPSLVYSLISNIKVGTSIAQA